MIAKINKPSDAYLNRYLEQQKTKAFSYRELGKSKEKSIKKYNNDYHFQVIGKGDIVWENAKALLRNWKQFPMGWTALYTKEKSIKTGDVVAVLFNLLGIWWINSARIVYVFDEPNRFGFAYGTLEGHVEKGEECFWLEKNDNQEIIYHIKAFSLPAHLLVWMAYPFSRMMQKKFVNDSMAQMKQLSNKMNTSVYAE